MNIQDAQRELRQAYMGGFVGQLVAAVIWALAAALGTWVSEGAGMAALFFVSMFLFPITQLIFRLMGRSTKLSPGNTLDQLAMQIAFTVPIGFILVGAATLHQQHWFFPAAMIIVGAHYLPFIFLYGMWQFGALAGVLIFTGTGLGLYGPQVFSLGGWISVVVFAVFAFVALSVVRKEARGD